MGTDIRCTRRERERYRERDRWEGLGERGVGGRMKMEG